MNIEPYVSVSEIRRALELIFAGKRNLYLSSSTELRDELKKKISNSGLSSSELLTPWVCNYLEIDSTVISDICSRLVVEKFLILHPSKDEDLLEFWSNFSFVGIADNGLPMFISSQVKTMS